MYIGFWRLKLAGISSSTGSNLHCLALLSWSGHAWDSRACGWWRPRLRWAGRRALGLRRMACVWYWKWPIYSGFCHEKWWFTHEKWWFSHEKWWFSHEKWWFTMNFPWKMVIFHSYVSLPQSTLGLNQSGFTMFYQIIPSPSVNHHDVQFSTGSTSFRVCKTIGKP